MAEAFVATEAATAVSSFGLAALLAHKTFKRSSARRIVGNYLEACDDARAALETAGIEDLTTEGLDQYAAAVAADLAVLEAATRTVPTSDLTT